MARTRSSVLTWTAATVLLTTFLASPAAAAPGGSTASDRTFFYLMPATEAARQITDGIAAGRLPTTQNLPTVYSEQTHSGPSSIEAERAKDVASPLRYVSRYPTASGVPAAPGGPSTLSWAPPPFSYDYVDTVEECLDNPASGDASGYIKNHYAFCRAMRGSYGRVICRFIFCQTHFVNFITTTIGYGSERDRKVRFVTHVHDIVGTPDMMGSTRLRLDMECDSVITIGNCVSDPGTPAVEKPFAAWAMSNYVTKIFSSTAPPPADFNPDRLEYADFWNEVRVARSGPGWYSQERDSPKQSVRFDSATYLNLNGRNGVIFNRTKASIPFPLDDPFYAPMRESARHYQQAMQDPESTIPYLLGKHIPGAMDDRPLERLYYDEQWRLDNRKAARGACITEWGPDYAEDGRYDCDEFPFASTRQGAAKSGGNFSVKRITPSDNQSAGTWLGAWYSYDRIIDGDPFHVRVY